MLFSPWVHGAPVGGWVGPRGEIRSVDFSQPPYMAPEHRITSAVDRRTCYPTRKHRAINLRVAAGAAVEVLLELEATGDRLAVLLRAHAVAAEVAVRVVATDVRTERNLSGGFIGLGVVDGAGSQKNEQEHAEHDHQGRPARDKRQVAVG